MIRTFGTGEDAVTKAITTLATTAEVSPDEVRYWFLGGSFPTEEKLLKLKNFFSKEAEAKAEEIRALYPSKQQEEKKYQKVSSPPKTESSLPLSLPQGNSVHHKRGGYSRSDADSVIRRPEREQQKALISFLANRFSKEKEFVQQLLKLNQGTERPSLSAIGHVFDACLKLNPLERYILFPVIKNMYQSFTRKPNYATNFDELYRIKFVRDFTLLVESQIPPGSGRPAFSSTEKAELAKEVLAIFRDRSAPLIKDSEQLIKMVRKKSMNATIPQINGAKKKVVEQAKKILKDQ